MDRPQQDKGPEVVEGSVTSPTQPTTIGVSSILPWIVGVVVVLLVLYWSSDRERNSTKVGAASLEQEATRQTVPDRSAVMCSELGELAEQAMHFRQTGGSKSDLLDVIDTRGSQETRMLARAIIDDAYNSTLHSDPDMQAVSASVFRALVEEACSNSG